MFDDSALTDEFIEWKQKKKEQKAAKAVEVKPQSTPASSSKGTLNDPMDEYNAWKRQKQTGKKEVPIVQTKMVPDEAPIPPTMFNQHLQEFLRKGGHKPHPPKAVTPLTNAPAAPASAAVTAKVEGKVKSTKEPTIVPTKTPHRPPYIAPTVTVVPAVPAVTTVPTAPAMTAVTAVSTLPTPAPAPTTKTPAFANVSLEFDLDDAFMLSPKTPSKIERCVSTKTINDFLKAVREEFEPLIPVDGIKQVWFHAMRHLAVQSLLIHAHKLTKQMQEKLIISEWDRSRAENKKKTFYERLLKPSSEIVFDKDTKWSTITEKLFLHDRSTSPQDEKRVATLVKQAERLERNPHPQALITLARGFCDEDITLLSTAPAFLNLDGSKKKWEGYLENEAFFLSDSPYQL